MLALFALAILLKAGQVQLIHGSQWRASAGRQQTTERKLPASRGQILDATRRVLAESREMVHLDVAPREVTEPGKLRRALMKLEVERRVIARALDTKVKWVTIPGQFLSMDAASATVLRGVHTTAAVTRTYSASGGAQGIIGRVGANNVAVDGIELALDTILRGTPGSTTLLRDPSGKSRESPGVPGTAPVQGHSVVLTINADLQEIAENALADAVDKMAAEGGDIVILDPKDGSILAMASRRADPRQTSATALTEPFEPGSTMKPFIAAGLLERGRVRDSDSVDTGNGVYELNGREIHDEHHLGRAGLHDVLRWSSNIGIVKFGQRLTPAEQFETLRDFGFGVPTGVPYPTESGGTLRPPRLWSQQSAASMAMGYEVSATPLQLALAYAAFANGGELLEPALVKEIVRTDGTVRYRHTRRVVRRVMSVPVADKVRHMLLGVVDEGTALQAALSNYMLAGKTGTPRGTVRGHYVAGRYNPNFVGLFPGDAPQYVIVVKLVAPQGAFYGGATAAPLTKTILQTAIAARDAALDRSKLASSVVASRETPRRDSLELVVAGAETTAAVATLAGSPQPRPVAADTARVPYVVTLPVRGPAPQREAPRAVPDVQGLPLRDAARTLHRAGFHVQLVRGGTGNGAAFTRPASGELAPQGSLVRLIFDY